MVKSLRSILVAGLLAAAVACGAFIVATSRVSAQAPGGAAGTFNFSGDYAPVFHEDQPERGAGPDIGDYLGIPMTEGARLAADTWTASKLTMPEHQCKPHPSDYSSRGPANLRIWQEIDGPSQQLIAFHTHISWQAPERTIWMDGRPHPPAYAAHTWQGFSTGRFDGDALVITTDHLKTGWIRRNGVLRSDLATVTETWTRHDNMLDWMVYVDDPIYLTEPFVRTTDFVENKRQQIAPYPCYPVVEIDRPVGVVPSNLFGQNPSLDEFSRKYGVPYDATRGGAETMLPEYVEKLNTMPKPQPAKSR